MNQFNNVFPQQGLSPLLQSFWNQLSSLPSERPPITPEYARISSQFFERFPTLGVGSDEDKCLRLAEGTLYQRRITDKNESHSTKLFYSRLSTIFEQGEITEKTNKRHKSTSSSDERGMTFLSREQGKEDAHLYASAGVIEENEQLLDDETISSGGSVASSGINQPEVMSRVSKLKNTSLIYSKGLSVEYLNKLNEVIEHTSGYEDLLEEWDNSISDFGIPDNMDIITQGRKSNIYIKHSVEKEGFIGALTGTISLSDHSGSKSVPFASFSKGVFYINRAYEGNFLQDLPLSENGNVYLKPVYSESLNELQFILLAKRKIAARENLTLQRFTPIKFTVGGTKRGVEG